MRSLKFDKITECFHCGDRRAQPTADIGAMAPRYRCCQRCIARVGVKRLKYAADEAEAFLIASKPLRRCGHCGAPLIQPPHGIILWCGECEAERRQVAGTSELLPERIM